MGVVLVVGCVGCGSDVTGVENPAGPSYIRLESEAGDWIGQGQAYDYSQADAIITVAESRGRLSVTVHGDERWSGRFALPGVPRPLEVGEFEGGLDWSGESRVCGGNPIGRFTLDAVTYKEGVLVAVTMRFEQRCEGAEAWLRGRIHWRADDPTVPPGPRDPAPAGLWAPGSGSVPPSGNVIYLESEDGDYVGGGSHFTYTPSDADIQIAASDGGLTVDIEGPERWSGQFQAMLGLERLQPGYYPDLRRHPFHNPAKGGLDWWGQGRGCNTLLGWFAVDEVSWADGALERIVLRFQQYCDGRTAALHGFIRWSTSD